MSIRDRLSGNEAIATAMRQINPDVFAMFPITPSTEIPQYFAQYVADGRVDTEFICVESEHSSMSACIGAEAAGCRAITATSSAGLSFMNEVLYVAASCRLPIVLAVACRALTGPININHDYSDSMAERDSGFIQIYAENNQEAYDNYLQAHRIGETPDVRLPVMICEDGFITSHALENIELESDEAVRAFVGEYHPENYLLKSENPLAVGPYGTSPYYMEARVAQAEAMKNAKRAILDVAAGRQGRPHQGPGVPPLPRRGACRGFEGLQSRSGAGQERGLLRLWRPPVRRDRRRLRQSGQAAQDGGHRLRPGRPGFHRGPGQTGLRPAGEDRRHRRDWPRLHPHGPAGSERGGPVKWLTI